MARHPSATLGLCIAAVALLCAARTLATPSVSVAVDVNNTIPNVVANAIIADGEGIDWTAAVLLVELDTGSVYNGTPNGDRPQDAFWGLPFFEILEWDTWIGIPGGVNDMGPHDLGCIGGIFEYPGCSSALSLSGQLIAAQWGGTGTTETGPTRIANISLTDDASGTWRLLTSFAGNVFAKKSGVVINGVMVPEPASLALLSTGALGLVRRRRAVA